MLEKKTHSPCPLAVYILEGKRDIIEIIPQVHMNIQTCIVFPRGDIEYYMRLNKGTWPSFRRWGAQG